MEEIARLQRHLPLLRSCAGWTAEMFGKKLGVSRQTISTFEKAGASLTLMQYLAIRQVFEQEIKKDQPEESSQTMLATLLEILVDHPDDYTSEDVDAALTKAKLMAPVIMKEPSDRKAMSTAWKTVMLAGGVALSAALLALLKPRND